MTPAGAFTSLTFRINGMTTHTCLHLCLYRPNFGLTDIIYNIQHVCVTPLSVFQNILSGANKVEPGFRTLNFDVVLIAIVIVQHWYTTRNNGCQFTLNTRFSLSMEMSKLTRNGTAEPVARDQILRRERGQRNIHFLCSADHDQDWQPYPDDDPYSC